MKRYAEALEAARKAMEINRYDPRMIESAGEALYFLGRWQEALASFSEYTTLVPTGGRVDSVYYYMGEIFIQMGRFSRADIALSTALYHSPNVAAWWSRLGYAREKALDYEWSLGRLQQGAEAQPQPGRRLARQEPGGKAHERGMRAAFTTFGCKLNQFETEALAAAFAAQGFLIVPAGEEAEVYVVNTCTVTSRGEQKARRLIRVLARRHPGSVLLVTGCYAQLGGEELAGLAPNVRVVPQERKDGLLDWPRQWVEAAAADAGAAAAAVPTTADGTSTCSPSACTRTCSPTASGAELRALAPSSVPVPAGAAGALQGDPFRFQVGRYRFHSRAFLKVQDGCDCRCAYCRVPLARGPAVSLEEGEVLRRVRDLEQAGYREVVLTGVNLSAWHSDGRGLAALLGAILAATNALRVRLSSLEPETVDEPLADAVRDPRVCAHFHLPIQSGSAAVLARMRRRYGPQRVREAVRILRAARGEPFLAADVLVGFPGESGEDFTQTVRLIEELELAQLHVFPFSPRPGTAAFGLGSRVPERVRDGRAAALPRAFRAPARALCWPVRGERGDGGVGGTGGGGLDRADGQLPAGAHPRSPAGARRAREGGPGPHRARWGPLSGRPSPGGLSVPFSTPPVVFSPS